MFLALTIDFLYFNVDILLCSTTATNNNKKKQRPGKLNSDSSQCSLDTKLNFLQTVFTVQNNPKKFQDNKCCFQNGSVICQSCEFLTRLSNFYT